MILKASSINSSFGTLYSVLNATKNVFGLELLISRSEERRVGKECKYRWESGQAEDGIRDWSVTGVQTCALPIYIQLVRVDLETYTLTRDIVRRDQVGVLLVYDLEGFIDQLLIRYVVLGLERHQECFRTGASDLQIGRASCRERV